MQEQKSLRSSEEFANMLAFLFITTFVIATAIIAVYFVFFHGGITTDHGRWAEFGDFIGGTVGTLVSFIALFALLQTIHLQSMALRISQKELKLTREEAAKASAAAEAQVKHFDTQSRIDDTVAAIKELESELLDRRKHQLICFDDQPKNVRLFGLNVFLEKNVGEIARLQFGDASPHQRQLISNRHEELGQVFKLLFDQIIGLREFPGAENRYRIFISKHLEFFFHLSKINALPFDWKAPLDEESRELLKIYEISLEARRAQ